MFKHGRESVAAMVAIGLVLAGCGGGDDDESSSTSAAPAVTTAADTESAATTAAAAPAPTAVTGAPETTIDKSRYEGLTLAVLGATVDINNLISDGVDDAFREMTGADIEYVEGSAANNLSQLLATGGEDTTFDVIFLDTPNQARAINAGLLQTLRKEDIPGHELLPASAFPAKGYGPGFYVIRLGACVNTEKFAEAGLELPASVDDWFDPALAGRIALPDPANFWWTTGIPALAAHFGAPLGDPEPLISQLSTLDIRTLFTSSADAVQLVVSGDAYLAPTSDGSCFRAKISGAPVEFAPLNVTVGGTTYPFAASHDTWDIPIGVDERKAELATIFMGLQLAPEGSLGVAKAFGFLPPRTDAFEQAAQFPEWQQANVIGDFQLEDAYLPEYDEFIANIDAWIDAWNRTFRS